MHDVLGEERDVTKGIGAMLKLAAEKGITLKLFDWILCMQLALFSIHVYHVLLGYLTDPNAKKNSGESLEHLKNKRYSQMESAKL